MPRNIEIKTRVDDFLAVRRKAAEIADEGPVEMAQDDTFFPCATGRLKLRGLSEDRGELIFYRRADAEGPKESTYRIVPTEEPELLREILAAAYGTAGRLSILLFAALLGLVVGCGARGSHEREAIATVVDALPDDDLSRAILVTARAPEARYILPSEFPGTKNCFPEVQPEPGLVRQLNALSRNPARLWFPLGTQRPSHLVSESSLFERLFGPTQHNPRYVFSRVAVDPSHDQALLWVEYERCTMCGFGAYFLLERQPTGGWKVVDECTVWLS